MTRMKTFFAMAVAVAPSLALGSIWWVLSPLTFAGSTYLGFYVSIGLGFVAGMALIHFVIPDCDWFWRP